MSTIIRTTTAEWEEANDKGDVVKKTITVKYRGQSIAQIKEYMAEVEERRKADPDAVFFPVSDGLARRLHRLPDLLGDKPITIDWLEEQDLSNLNAIRDAIHASDNPEKK